MPLDWRRLASPSSLPHYNLTMFRLVTSICSCQLNSRLSPFSPTCSIPKDSERKERRLIFSDSLTVRLTAGLASPAKDSKFPTYAKTRSEQIPDDEKQSWEREREEDQLARPRWLTCFQLEIAQGHVSLLARREREQTAINILSRLIVDRLELGNFWREPFAVCKINKRTRLANVACLSSFDIVLGGMLFN